MVKWSSTREATAGQLLGRRDVRRRRRLLSRSGRGVDLERIAQIDTSADLGICTALLVIPDGSSLSLAGARVDVATALVPRRAALGAGLGLDRDARRGN